jgi:hypothetical protein
VPARNLGALTRRARRASAALLAGLSAWLAPLAASAYRPFDGTDADVAEAGEFELELGPLHYAQEGEETSLFTPTVLNLGLVPRLEFIIDFVPVLARSGGGAQLKDGDVFLKYLLRSGTLQAESGPSIAIEGGPLLPELNGESGVGASLNLALSQRWGSWTVHLNNEAELSRRELVFSYAADLMGELELGAPLRPVAELGFEIEPSSGATSYAALGGVIWSVAEDFALDAAARVGRREGVNAFEARLGLTWAIQIW